MNLNQITLSPDGDPTALVLTIIGNCYGFGGSGRLQDTIQALRQVSAYYSSDEQPAKWLAELQSIDELRGWEFESAAIRWMKEFVETVTS